ncbi:hypothetical protein NPIL_283031 [Nephila pilipes]|uniref:Uncharacterized protein n=1 Tax=Nephila pilipes TaxID=299642 RepID=A0A8X6U4L4_NEPPI|nr:hypothetical protein NPIL_283031 [Nephila pilipes]
MSRRPAKPGPALSLLPCPPAMSQRAAPAPYATVVGFTRSNHVTVVHTLPSFVTGLPHLEISSPDRTIVFGPCNISPLCTERDQDCAHQHSYGHLYCQP